MISKKTDIYIFLKYKFIKHQNTFNCKSLHNPLKKEKYIISKIHT